MPSDWLLFEIMPERVIGGYKKPALATLLQHGACKRMPERPGVVSPVDVLGVHLPPASNAVPAPEPMNTLFFSFAMSDTAKATAELGTSTTMSTPSTSNQRRTMAAPTSGLFCATP
jgi:hypothetical protein